MSIQGRRRYTARNGALTPSTTLRSRGGVILPATTYGSLPGVVAVAASYKPLVGITGGSQAAFDDINAIVGPVTLRRTYNSTLPASWAASSAGTDVGTGRSSIWSFIPNMVTFPTDTPAKSAFSAFLDTIPVEPGVRKIIHVKHEPEDEIAAGTFTLAQWGAVQDACGAIIRGKARADLLFGPCFQGPYTFDSRSPYYAYDWLGVCDESLWDVVGLDPYRTSSGVATTWEQMMTVGNAGSSSAIQSTMAKMIAWGKQIVLSEFGVFNKVDGSGTNIPESFKISLIQSAYTWGLDNNSQHPPGTPGYLIGMAYFNYTLIGSDCPLTTAAQQQAYAAIVADSKVSTTATSTTGVPTQQAGRWWSDFSSSTALTPDSGPPAVGAEWSGWGQDDRDTYGVPALVSAATEGIGAPPSGDRVAKLRHSGAQSPFGSDYTSGLHNMHKFYKQFTTTTWPGGAEPTNRNDGAPADVSGRYITYLYFRSSQMNFVSGYWSNTVQFKEDYADTTGAFHSDPSWWLGFNSFNNPSSPVFNLSCWGGTHDNGVTRPLSSVVDRWVKFEMRIYQGVKIEAYIDDVLFDTGLQSECPVGRRNLPGVTGSSGGTVQASLGWTFGVGNYTNGNDYPAGASGVYVDLSTVLPLP